MRRISHDVALCCALLILVPMPCFSADLPAGPDSGNRAGTEICFPVSDGERILHVLESMAACREAVEAGDAALGSCEARSQALEGRVVEQDRELQDARKVIEDTRKVGEQAVKAATPPWYSRILSAGKWIGVGILVGFVAGAGK